MIQVDPAINDVVKTIPLARGNGQRWSQMEVGPNAVYVCRCLPIPGGLVRFDTATTSRVSVHRGPVGTIAYGEGALWAQTGYEADSIKRIDPRTNAVVAIIPLGRIGESHGYRTRITVGEGAVWVATQQSLWKIDPAINRFVDVIHLGPRGEGNVAAGDGAVWVQSFIDRALLRVDPESLTEVKQIPLGPLIYPVGVWDGIAVGEGAVWVGVTSYAS